MNAYRTIYSRLGMLWPPSWEGTARAVRETPRDALWRRVAAEAPLLTRSYR
jgi:hypothetical protein